MLCKSELIDISKYSISKADKKKQIKIIQLLIIDVIISMIWHGYP